MKRFRFNLEAALSVRRRAEEQAQIELGARQRELAAAEARLEELRSEQRRHQDHRAGLLQRALDPHALADADRYGSALARALLLQEDRTWQAQEAVRTAMDALRDRRVEREALERLREQQLQAHRAETLRLEQQTLDEMSVLRWGRGA